MLLDLPSGILLILNTLCNGTTLVVAFNLDCLEVFSPSAMFLKGSNFQELSDCVCVHLKRVAETIVNEMMMDLSPWMPLALFSSELKEYMTGDSLSTGVGASSNGLAGTG